MLKMLIIITLLIASNQSIAKSKCEKEWNALKSVQSQLRNKSTEYLRNKEHTKHSEYQNCRKNKSKESNNEKTKTKYVKPSYVKPNYVKKSSISTTKNITNNISLKGKFEDEKQDAWIQYYDKPQECISPKKVQEFSKCLNHRDDAAKKFNVMWGNKQ